MIRPVHNISVSSSYLSLQEFGIASDDESINPVGAIPLQAILLQLQRMEEVRNQDRAIMDTLCQQTEEL
jgi:hypothetical protein